MDWDDLRLFLAIARAGSLSGAAATLGITQPSVGRRLKRMEDRFGARLLERTPSGFVMTAMGEAIHANAERMELEAQGIERCVAGRDAKLEGTVRITTVEVLAQAFLVPLSKLLLETHPGIALEILPDTRSLSLSRRETDIAIRLTRFEGHELFVRRLGTLSFGIYGSDAYLADRPSSDRLISVQENQRHLPEVVRYHHAFPGGRTVLTTNDRSVQIEAAVEGVGLICVADSAVTGRSELRRLEFDDIPAREIWMGVHGDLRHTARIQAVINAAFALAGDARVGF